jgi:hypothetical protein
MIAFTMSSPLSSPCGLRKAATLLNRFRYRKPAIVVVATARSCLVHMASRHNGTLTANHSKIGSSLLKYYFP